MNIIGNGVDIVQNDRIKKSLKISGFKSRIFTKYEILHSKKNKNKTNYFAKRFAAKEAFVKSLGIGFRENINFVFFDSAHSLKFLLEEVSSFYKIANKNFILGIDDGEKINRKTKELEANSKLGGVINVHEKTDKIVESISLGGVVNYIYNE